MTRRLASFTLCIGMAILGGACATKGFVDERVGQLESKLAGQITTTHTNLAERADLQEKNLRDTAERTGENRQAVDVADERLRGLDTRVGEVDSVAEGAKTRADRAACWHRMPKPGSRSGSLAATGTGSSTQSPSISALVRSRCGVRTSASSTRWRRRWSLIPTRSSSCKGLPIPRAATDSTASSPRARGGRGELPRATAWRRAAPTAGDRHGQVTLAPGEKPSAEALARARRVDIRLFSPWSSWEDTQAQSGRGLQTPAR